MIAISTWGIISVVGYVLTFLLIPWVLLTKKRHPVSTVAWIMAIVMLPYLGGLLFLLIGINHVDRRTAHKQRANLRIAGRFPELSEHQLLAGEGLNEQQQELKRLASQTSDCIATFGNRIEVLSDTNRTLGLIEQAVLAAKESLHLEYYIWQPDRTGTRLRDLLIRKAKEGVTIRFLYDKIGSIWLSNRFLKPMRDAGIHVASFLPGTTFRERWSINLRNHRKIVIVDGQIGFTGGMNIGDEYHGRNPSLGFWRDTHLKIQGPVTLQLQQIFAEDWFYATGEELTQPRLFPKPEESGNVAASVLASGPDGEIDVLHTLMFAAINEARERITLATSYFAPTAALVTALESAAYRGVDVRLLISGRATHYWTVLAGRSFYDSLLKAGVCIDEYEKGLFHPKVLVVDGNWSLVGTPNFDTRSLLLNFEVAVVMYDTKISARLEEQFDHDLKSSRPILLDTWMKRPVRQILAENFCRLFAPLM